ncbi:MAG TPA: prepilin-type N-terminal cleavage/methylation domain-containing protein [Gemmatimonadales bacterium]
MSPRSERGFTLAELLVAVVIFSIGLLALAGTASVIMTSLTSTQSRTIAAGVAESRMERIRTTTCANRASGSATTRGIAETWTLSHMPRAEDDVTVSVTFLSNHRPRSETFRSFIPC